MFSFCTIGPNHMMAMLFDRQNLFKFFSRGPMGYDSYEVWLEGSQEMIPIYEMLLE